MSAQWRDELASEDAGTLLKMTTAHLPAVMAIEVAIYPFPWSRGNFIDSLAAGYPARVLMDARGAMLGYFVAMGGVDEMHLLNITVAEAAQGRGHARRMMTTLIALCHEQLANELWLEVRESNALARSIYARMGFEQKGVRKGYYPAPLGRREDAIVMSLKLEGHDALE